MSRYTDLNTEFLESNAELNPLALDKASIIKGLLRFFQTPIGSDPFNRDYGCTLYSLLFENHLTLSDVQMFLYMDITTFEPRINISPTGIILTRLDEHTVQLQCVFTIPGLNDESVSLNTTITQE